MNAFAWWIFLKKRLHLIKTFRSRCAVKLSLRMAVISLQLQMEARLTFTNFTFPKLHKCSKGTTARFDASLGFKTTLGLCHQVGMPLCMFGSWIPDLTKTELYGTTKSSQSISLVSHLSSPRIAKSRGTSRLSMRLTLCAASEKFKKVIKELARNFWSSNNSHAYSK
jgi:hypothetical protein